MNLRERTQALFVSIDALTMRERLFVFAAMLMVIGAAWEGLLNGPLTSRSEVLQQKIVSTAQSLEQLDEAITVAAAGLDGGNIERTAMLQSLRDAIAVREQELRVFTSDLIDPAQMRLVVEDLLKHQHGLRLVRAQNVPAAPLIVLPEPESGAQADEPNLYRHGLVIELEGSYLELLAYLESIERLPWRIFWGRLDLEALEHPRLKITVELNTLSLEREWLGV